MSLDLPAVLPLFPLPEVVFFPSGRMPLNVFEPRYLTLIGDVQAGDGWLAVPQLTGEVAEDGRPVFHEIAGAGRLTRVEPTPDGRFLIEIQGMARVRLEEIDVHTAYRQARAEELPEPDEWLERPEGARELRDLVRLARRVHVLDPGTGEVPDKRRSRRELVDGVAGRVMADARERQALLEAPDYRARTAALLRHLRVMDNTLRAVSRGGPPPNPENN